MYELNETPLFSYIVEAAACNPLFFVTTFSKKKKKSEKRKAKPSEIFPYV